ncbi:MAG: hypothetical protein DDT26_01460 [Dehalococcoidia bacterium]|nr:hypothetical protein [Chloroflexota bacterium]
MLVGMARSPSAGIRITPTSANILMVTSHTTICSRPAEPSPSSFPRNICLAEMEESKISITRFSFSSETLCSIRPELENIEIMKRNPKIKGTRNAISG